MPQELDESPNDAAIPLIDGSITSETPEGGYVTINPEYKPYKNGILESSRFIVYYLHPEHGSSDFMVEPDDDANCSWKSDNKPPFVIQELINWIGDKVEKNDC